jgi:hypothetical protein
MTEIQNSKHSGLFLCFSFKTLTLTTLILELCLFWSFEHLGFEFVSDFVLRASNLVLNSVLRHSQCL